MPGNIAAEIALYVGVGASAGGLEAIETGIVDFILSPENMISHILSCIQHPFAQKITAQSQILAILCQDIMETLEKKIRVKIFAADVDKRAILTASDGCYHENITADLTPRQLAKYFYRKGTDFQISRQIREMVVFAQHNILKDPPFTKIDIVTCRNMLIYLQPVLQKKALEKFNFALNPGGILFLGSSDSIGEMNYYFNSLNHKWKIYRSKGKRSPILGIPERYVPERYPSKPIATRHRETRPKGINMALTRLDNITRYETQPYAGKNWIIDLVSASERRKNKRYMPQKSSFVQVNGHEMIKAQMIDISQGGLSFWADGLDFSQIRNLCCNVLNATGEISIENLNGCLIFDPYAEKNHRSPDKKIIAYWIKFDVLRRHQQDQLDFYINTHITH